MEEEKVEKEQNESTGKKREGRTRGIREKLAVYCDIWAVSRKRMVKHVATERLFPGNQLISKHSFPEYGH
jgi:hypothetical protein